MTNTQHRSNPAGFRVKHSLSTPSTHRYVKPNYFWWTNSKMTPNYLHLLVFTPLFYPQPWAWAGLRLASNQWNAAKIMWRHFHSCVAWTGNIHLANRLPIAFSTCTFWWSRLPCWGRKWGQPLVNTQEVNQVSSPTGYKKLNPANNQMSLRVSQSFKWDSSPSQHLDSGFMKTLKQRTHPWSAQISAL